MSGSWSNSTRYGWLLTFTAILLLLAPACSNDQTGTGEFANGANGNDDDSDTWSFEEDTEQASPDAEEQSDATSNGDDATGNGDDDAGNGSEQPGDVYVGTGDPYTPGSLAVERVNLDQAPAELLVVVPTEDGVYPVVVFQHGFLMANTHYGDLLDHVASHGFVVVAPQMYEPGGLPIGKPSTDEETELAGQVYDWLEDNLDAALDVEARTDLLGLAGHSRGAKVIWWSLRDDPRDVGAVAGVDPVDGTGGPLGGEPRILDNPPTIEVPKLLIGTGLGPVEPNLLQPACAPEGDNYEDFYAAATTPTWEVVAPDYGHNDMLDDDPSGCGEECDICPAGDARQPMRTLTAGMLVALYRAALQGDDDALDILSDHAAAPVTIETRSK